METIIINIHSVVDLITNSTTEIFMIDPNDTFEVIESIIEEKNKEFEYIILNKPDDKDKSIS